MKIRLDDKNFGAAIDGVDLAGELDGRLVRQLDAVLSRYGFLSVRNQKLKPQDLVRVANSLGGIRPNSFFPNHPSEPHVSVIEKKRGHRGILGAEWHVDHSYEKLPVKASILYCVRTPPKGGNTRFLGSGIATKSIPRALFDALVDSFAVHESAHIFGPTGRSGGSEEFKSRIRNRNLANHETIHPILIKEPISKKAALYVNPNFTTHIVGLDSIRSKSILNEVYQHVLSNGPYAELEWETGTVGIWNNFMTWHRGSNDFDGDRLMWRAAVGGTCLEKYS